MSGWTSSTDRRGAARTRGLVLLVAAALGITGLVAALATVGGDDDDGPSRSAARAGERRDPPAADLVGAPDTAPRARVEAEDTADPDAPIGEARIAGALAGPGWANGAPIEVHLAGLTEDGEQVRREQSLDGLGATWAFEGLPPGIYVARASASSSPRRAWGESEPMTLNAEASEDGVVVRMREYVLEGIVTASDDAPLTGLRVTVDWNASRSALHVARRSELENALVSYATDLEGLQSEEVEPLIEDLESDLRDAVIIDSFEVSEWEVGAELELQRAVAEVQRQHAQAVEEVMRVQLELESIRIQSFDAPQADVFISGIALGSGLGYGGPSGEPVIEDEESHRQLVATTDALGRFKLWLPGPGHGSARAPGEETGETGDSSERWRWYRPSREQYAVHVEEPRASVELELVHVGSLHGVVTAPPRGGDQDLEVFARPLEGERTSTRHTTAGEGGRYAFENLRPGRYVLYGRSGGSAGQDVSHRTVVQVHGGAEARVDLPLATSSSVVGVLVNAKGAPIAGARITAYGEDNDNLSRNGRTDANGRFTIVGMYGGPYVIKADEHTLVEEPRLRVPQGGAVVDAGRLRVAPPPEPKDVGMAPGTDGGGAGSSFTGSRW